jgi:RNA polymerase sigma factor (sigma-70 family)
MNPARDSGDLLHRIHAGDADAMEEMVHEELPRIYNLCLRLCRRAADAEDLCQDIFIRAVRAVPQFKGDSSFSTWLYRIAVNTWKNRVRYEKRRFFGRHVSLTGNVDGMEGETPDLDLPDAGMGPAEQVELSEEHRRLLAAIEHLDPDDKTIVLLRDMEDKAYEEISAALGMNIGTVKSRLSRAREKLREIFHRLGAGR